MQIDNYSATLKKGNAPLHNNTLTVNSSVLYNGIGINGMYTNIDSPSFHADTYNLGCSYEGKKVGRFELAWNHAREKSKTAGASPSNTNSYELKYKAPIEIINNWLKKLF